MAYRVRRRRVRRRRGFVGRRFVRLSRGGHRI